MTLGPMPCTVATACFTSSSVCVVRPEHAAAVLEMAREIDAREAEQARLIVEAKSLKQGLAKYGRI